MKTLHERVLGRIPTVSDVVFLSPDGVAWGRPTNNFARILYRVFESAGIPRLDVAGRSIDVHSLRTTCGTRFARANVGLAITQRILGHSTPAVTAKHYTILEVDDLRRVVEAVGAKATAARAESVAS